MTAGAFPAIRSVDSRARVALLLFSALLAAPRAGAQCVVESQLATASDVAPGDQFGRSVSIDEDLALVGSPGDDVAGANTGSAYLFERQGPNWAQVRQFVPSDAASLRQFGRSVSISGAVIAIGATDDFLAVQGAAYVFGRHGPAWTQDAKLVAGDAAGNDRFGWSIATDGQTIVVGAVGDHQLGNQAGAAYVFERNGTSWPLVQKLVASDGGPGSIFGSWVDVEGDRIVIAAHRASAGLFLSGEVYVFERAGGTWTESARLLPHDSSAVDEFGRSVGLSGNRIAVGSVGDDDMGHDAGAVYVFELAGGTWVERQKLVAPDGAGEASFGYALGLDADALAIGARADDELAPGAGAVYVFESQAPFWYPTAKLLAPGGAAGDELGFSVALARDRIAAGAYRADTGGLDAGAVAFFSHALGPLERYCASAPNSVGGGARISGVGTTSLAADDFALVVNGAVPGQPGLFYYGAQAIELPFGDGFRCVGNGASAVHRIPPVLVPDFVGDVFLALDYDSPTLGQGPDALVAGSTWCFQFYYRDPHGPGGSGFNFSDAVRVGFCP